MTERSDIDALAPADGEHRAPTMKEIVAATAQFFSISAGRLRSMEERVPSVVRARHVAMFLCRVDARRSYPEIGRHFGADHTTVLAADRKVFARREGGDRQLEQDLKSVRAILARVLEMPAGGSPRPLPCAKCEELREERARQREEILMLRQELAALRVRFGCD